MSNIIMEVKLILAFLFVSFLSVNCFDLIERRNGAINASYLEEVIDAQECDRQVKVIRENALLLLQFADAGLRTPRGILTGNTIDLGNYHQCLGIDHQLEEMHIQGKYCSIEVPFDQQLHLPRSQDLEGLPFNPNSLRVDNATMKMMQQYDVMRRLVRAIGGDFNGLDLGARSSPENPLSTSVFSLSVCVPKPCTTEQAITSLLFNVSQIGFNYTDAYCRLPNDKPWVTADFVAVSFFAVLGGLTLISTCYDIGYRFVLNKDVKQMSVLYRSFSVYTNGEILTTFKSVPGTIQCLDGIRTLAMLWVIVCHSFSSEPFVANPIDLYSDWLFSPKALWITAGTMTVDTFFTMAGVLLVYTTVGKMNQMTFVKNLHWFYLNRFMRVTPMLGIAVLLQVSFYNQIADGPYWVTVADQVERCRENWLMTMLHVQNIVHPENMCLPHSWYIAIDFQLYVISPFILFWVFSGKSRTAWSSLLGGLLVVLIISTGYCFYIDLPGGALVPSRLPEFQRYYDLYYFNTLTRASPFFVGLVFGYLLHVYRKKRLNIPVFVAMIYWACSAGIFAGIFYFKYRIKQNDWDNHFMDNFMNSFMRPCYACAICWLIIACVHGYSGPINWFLSHEYWRLPARLSYGMYLFHQPLMFTLNATMVVPIYFTVERYFFKFLAYVVWAVVYSFVFTLTVDTPISVLFKMLMDAAKPKPPAVKADKKVDEDIPEKLREVKSEDNVPEVMIVDTKDVKPKTTEIHDEPQTSKNLQIESKKDPGDEVVRIDDTGILRDTKN
ncbi:nose resistant to fluoxetine protein 6-like [Trichoplusia ni]|uniref:Nose resistant to fluoxetine protein 6-like n=1 Tax=Trichoplusia ni TaxID=7111 RepID=A0A7E5VXY9_TRINI|nr:nose resistant to fluoxetine protein 6-like [Trichoplusia ni]